jgi:ABC-type glycerol-3-phosphate transport system substrate-binding protein
MDSFTFSFGTKVKIEMDDGSMYEAEAIVPKGASSKDQTDVVMNKLNYSIGEQQRAKALYELLIPTTPAKKFMESIVMYTRDNPS